MNQTRGFLYIALAVLSFLLFQDYTSDQQPKPEVKQELSSSLQIDNANLLKLDNGLLSLAVNSKTGDFLSATLDTYSQTVKDNKPLEILSPNNKNYFIVLNGLYGAQGTDSATKRADYLVKEQSKDSVTLEYVTDGITYDKTISLVKDSYEVKVSYKVTNESGHTISLAPYSQFIHKRMEGSSLFSSQNIYGTNSSYAGVVTSTDKDNYDKVSYGDIQDNDFVPVNTKEGWTAISQHFFVSAYVPASNIPFTIRTDYQAANQNYIVAALTDLQTLANGQTQTFHDKYWFGPKLQDELKVVGKDLNLVVDYGWAWFLSTPLWWLMKFLNSIFSNWGLTIIALTICVRLIIMPLSIIQFRNQAIMRVIQPEIAAANERAGEDRMKKMQETQKVFKRYGASQFTGCFPALIQLPIFLALFYLVNEAVELRHQPFFGWISDLSQSDPYFILPILNGLLMVYMFSLNPMPENMDPTQRKIMKAMPYMIMIFFLFLPSGLITYYIVSNIITILFMLYFNRKISKQFADGTLVANNAHKKAKKPSKFAEKLNERIKEAQKAQEKAKKK